MKSCAGSARSSAADCSRSFGARSPQRRRSRCGAPRKSKSAAQASSGSRCSSSSTRAKPLFAPSSTPYCIVVSRPRSWRSASSASLRPVAEIPATSHLTIRRYLPILDSVPRRKPGTLLPLETKILEVALSTLRSGQTTFHGFGLAQTMREQSGSRSLTAHGTLYKALSRLEEFGLLTSHWEDAEAAAERRPRRRLYELTGEGARVAERALAEKAVAPRSCAASEPT